MSDRLVQYWPKGKPPPPGARVVNTDFNHHSDLIEFDEMPVKPRMTLLPTKPLVEVAAVLTDSAEREKYELHGWRAGRPWSGEVDAALRHIGQWVEREGPDEQTGRSHLAHAVSRLLMVLHYELTGTGDDDRPT